MRSIGFSALFVALASQLLFARSLPAQQQAEEPTTITRLILRDYEISISHSANGEIGYDINSRDGDVLGVNLNQEQLQAQYPHIYDTLRPAIANDRQESDSMLLMLAPTVNLDSE
ncbi:MAG: hypothetical protein SWY16_10635 [Cyanobacteriota bacterium]|nr:hypothetical protein [Cyanobacteriota bacterium]